MANETAFSSSEGSGLADIQRIAAAMGDHAPEDSVETAPVEDGAFVVAPSLEAAAPDAPIAVAPTLPAGGLLPLPAPSRRDRRPLVAALTVSLVVLLGAVGVLGVVALRRSDTPQAAAADPATPRLAATVPQAGHAATAPPPGSPRGGIAAGLAGAVAGREVQKVLDEEEDEPLLVLEDEPETTTSPRRARQRPIHVPKVQPEEESQSQAAEEDDDAAGGVADPFAGLAPGDQEAVPTEASAADEPDPRAVAPSSAPTADDVDVDCLVNRDLPKCAAFRSSAKKRAAGTEHAQDDLPEKLAMPDVRTALRPVKAAARACARQHGAAPGTKVRVKLSIEGATGLVLSAAPLGEHAESPLGRCVASKFGAAKFPRFRAKRMGLTYPIIL